MSSKKETKSGIDHLKQLVSRLALVLGFMMLFGIFILGQDFRENVGGAVGILFDPLIPLMPLHIVIFIMASITGIYASVIQKVTNNWELMRRTQKRMREFQKKFKEATKRNDQALISKLNEQRKDMMKDQGEMSKQQFKPMAYISIISIPLWMWVYVHVSGDPTLTFVLPLVGLKNYTDPWFFLQYWIVWYFLCSMPISQVVRKLMNVGAQ